MKNIKNIWLSACAFSFVLLVSVFFVPAASAENPQEQQEYALRSFSQSEGANLQKVFELLQQYYVDGVDPDLLYRGAMEGMINAVGDPYTVYVYRDTMLSSSLQDTTQGTFGGVGITITKPVVSTALRPAYVQVSAPLEDTPGWRAGIQSGDYIIKIEDTATDTISMERVLQMLRGEPGTDVKIVIRRGKNIEFPVSITRAVIEVPTIKFAPIDNKIGYVRLIEFTRYTSTRMIEALKELTAQGCTSFIVDLRGNPGGLISSAVEVSSVFLNSGVVVSTRTRNETVSDEFTVKRSTFKLPQDYPVILLINRSSASASEIVAGALKDHKRAYLVGERSFGKGSVQHIAEISQNEAVKLTVARYYTPSDVNIDKIGIAPDTEALFPILTDTEEKNISELLNTTRISDFVDNKKTMSKSQVQEFAKELAKEYPARLDILERLIKQNFNRTHGGAPVFDRDYDIQLNTAIEILHTKDVSELLKHTKTVREMQDDETKKNNED